ncbi:MAG: hypothetical protein ACERLB_11585 [Gammaproteobacteria bacterium]
MRQIKAPIAANSQSIGKIGNDELVRSGAPDFNEQMLNHELIIGSLHRLLLLTGGLGKNRSSVVAVIF